VESKRAAFPFRIVGAHTRHGTVIDKAGISFETKLGVALPSVEEFLDRSRPEVVLEITTLNPSTGEPAIANIRAAFERGCHVVTANKGPIAHAYSSLKEEARRAGVEFRFESTVMDGAPVFNMVRNTLPGVRILGFTGALNSTSKMVVAAMREGKSMDEGIREAQRMGIAEADAAYDIDGWDSAAKTAALANVLMDAGVKPQDVERRGIRRLTADRVQDLARQRKTPVLISRARTTPGGIRLRVRAEVLDDTDVIASVQGTSNILLLHTDLMGTVGTVSISPGVRQTAYGLFSDLVDVAKSL
jgi:homoserine dehydrogenase